MELQDETTLNCAKECLKSLHDTSRHIDSFKHTATPGNSKLTVYSELIELKNTLDAMKAALVKLISPLQRNIPHSVLQSILNALIEVLHILYTVDQTTTAETWAATLVRIYQLDFLLAFQCHQLQEICVDHYFQPTSLLCTSSSKEFWDTYFNHQWFVPWPQFWERVLQRGWAEPGEEKAIRHFLDFCVDNVVSPYELCLFLKWFGQMELAFKNLIMTLKSGLLVGAIPATEANILLKGKMSGSFLVRFSKTRPGCFAVTVGSDNSAPRHFLLNYLEPGKFSMQHSDTIYTSIHNFVQMQPRLKYPVTTRAVSELMADVPTIRTSVEIHSPSMRSILDIRCSTGSSGSFSDFMHLSTSPSSQTHPLQSKHADSRNIYNSEASHQQIPATTCNNAMKTSGGVGFGPLSGAPNSASFASHNSQHSNVQINGASNPTWTGTPASTPMGFGPPSASFHPGQSGTSPTVSSQPMGFGPASGTGTLGGFGQTTFGFGPPRLSTSPAGFAPIQRNTTGFSQNPATHNSAGQVNLTSTMIPQTLITATAQAQNVPPSSTLSQSPSERNAMFFPPISESTTPNSATASTQQAAPSQPSQLRRSTSQQVKTLDPKTASKLSIRKSNSSQIRRARADQLPPGELEGPDLFEYDLRSGAPLDICVICLDRERSTVFLECSHMVCCTECSGLVSTCPICRQIIVRVVPVYRS